jgi:carbonic anhydrase
MIASRVEIVSFLAGAASLLMGASASEEGVVFSYDPNSEFGPSKWGDLDIDGNECTGESNSPIAVETSGCTRFEDYSFSVSTWSASCRRVNEQSAPLPRAAPPS